MGDLEGVGRVYRPELNPHPERHIKIDRSEPDKQGHDHPQQESEPQDKVELHDGTDQSSQKAPKPSPKDHKLDISA